MSAIEKLLSQRPSTTLYHYTSPAGLLGIVQSKSLWASGIHYLNDSSEYRHAARVLQECARRALMANPDHPWKELYLELLDSERTFEDPMVFVGSLSEAGDKLSQWRAYCPPGGGFSIGLSPDVILRQAARQDFQLVRCEYRPAEQTAICEELISAGCRAAVESLPTEDPRLLRRPHGLLQKCYKPLMRIGPAFKNPSFEEEQEWRLIRGPFEAPDQQVRFRPGEYAVIPYREFALADANAGLEFEEVIIGPNPDPEQAHNSLLYLFTAYGVEYNKISNYTGTLRNW